MSTTTLLSGAIERPETLAPAPGDPALPMRHRSRYPAVVSANSQAIDCPSEGEHSPEIPAFLPPADQSSVISPRSDRAASVRTSEGGSFCPSR